MEPYLLPSVTYYDYQKDIIRDAINSTKKSKIPSYGLFLDCGLGKTLVSMTIAINYYKLGLIDKVEVIFPASLKGNWNQEINKFVPVEYRGIFNVSFSHQGVSRGNIPELNKRTLLVIDESHNFSSGDSSRTKLMVKIANKFAGILSLSGTPKTNSAIQLLYQSNYLGFKISKKEFVDKYCYTKVINIPYFRNGKRFILTKQAYSADMKSESEFLSWFTTRSKFMRTEDAVDLPEKVYVKRYYELTKEQKKILERIKEKLESIEPSDDNVKASLHTLTQVYSGTFLDEDIESPKLELLAGLLEELGEKQLIIFTNYKSELSKVCKKLSELNISYTSMSGDQFIVPR